jgi:hypothetical protein
VYLEDFCLRVPPLEDMIPKEDTVDISDMLSRIKKDVSATYLDVIHIETLHMIRQSVGLMRRFFSL